MLKHALFVAVVINPCGTEKPEVRGCDPDVEDCHIDTADNAGEIRCYNHDKDGDGYQDDGCGPIGTDCDDRDAAVHPGAVEKCDEDGMDEDCDGVVAV